MGALYISVFNTEKNHGGIAIRCLLFPGLNGKEVYKGRNEANIAKNNNSYRNTEGELVFPAARGA